MINVFLYMRCAALVLQVNILLDVALACICKSLFPECASLNSSTPCAAGQDTAVKDLLDCRDVESTSCAQDPLSIYCEPAATSS